MNLSSVLYMHVIGLIVKYSSMYVLFLPCFTLIDQNVKIQSSGKNDRLLSGDIKYIGLLQTFSPLKPSSYTSAISKSNQQTT